MVIDFNRYIAENDIFTGNDLKGTEHSKFVEWVFKETEFLDRYPKLSKMGVRLHCLEVGVYEIPKCNNPECGNEVKTLSFDKESPNRFKRKFSKYCSYKCSAVSKETKEKRKTTLEERYGVQHNSGIDDFQEKRKNTMVERYGVEDWMQSPENLEKWKLGFFKLYGADHPMKLQENLNKAARTNTVNHGGKLHTRLHLTDEAIRVLSSKEELESLYEEKKFMRLVADHLGCHFSSVQRAMSDLGIEPNQSHKSSIGELEVAEFIESLGFETIRSDRSILSPYESDIVVPEKNLIVEYNGIYWHSEEHKPKKYHQDKSLTAHSKGFELVHVWEDDWMDDHKRQIIKDKLKSKLNISDQKVFARKTTIKKPSKEEVRSLMENHHIQGFVGYSQAFGLYEGDSLVACMTLRKTKEEGVYDLNRYASSKTVVGGMSKLLSHVKKNFDFKEIYTYAHLDYSSGSVYEKSGFERKHITPAGLWYVKRGEAVRLRRERFMKHKLPRIFGSGVDMNKTESEIMADHGYYRLFDAGSIKFVLKP